MSILNFGDCFYRMVRESRRKRARQPDDPEQDANQKKDACSITNSTTEDGESEDREMSKIRGVDE